MLEQAGQNKKVMDLKLKTNQEIIKEGRPITFRNRSIEKIGGFIQVPNFILAQTDLTAGAKLIYGILQTHAWLEESGFRNIKDPMSSAQESLAARIGMSVRSIKTYIQELKERGFISIIRRGLNLPNIYVIEDTQSGSAKSALQEVQVNEFQEVQNLPPNSKNIDNKTNRYKYNNRDVKDVVSLFNLNFPEHKNTLRYKGTRNYLSKIGKEQMITNLENLSYINPRNPAGYLHTVMEKGNGIIKVTKEGQKTRKQKEEKDKEETFKEKFKQDWMDKLKTTNKRIYELLEQYESLSAEEKRKVKEKAEKMVNKSFIGWPREKEVMCIIAGLIEKGE